MQKNRMLGLGVCGLAVVVAASAIGVGCTGDDQFVSPTTTDSGTPDSGVTADTGPGTDSGTPDANRPDAAGPERAKIMVAHGAPELGPVRICFATNGAATPNLATDMAALPPLPNKASGANPAALPPGAGGVLPNTGANLGAVNLTPVIFKVASIIAANGGAVPATEKDCVELMKGNLPHTTKDVDYFVLPTIPKGTFADASTILVLATGCPLGITDAARVAKCGPGYDVATGNLKAIPIRLDRGVAAAGKNRIQFVHGATPLDPAIKAQSGGATSAIQPFLVEGGAATTALAAAALDAASVVTGGAATPAVDATISLTTTSVGFKVGATLVPTSAQTMAQTIGLMKALDPTTPSTLADTAGYTFILLGDPTVTVATPADALNAAHYLLLPNNPFVPAF